MKSAFVTALVAAGLMVCGPALASEKLSKDNGCVKCHDATAKKKGPSIKDIAAKYKGKGVAVDKLVAAVKSDEHPEVKASDADLKAIVGWMLQ